MFLHLGGDITVKQEDIIGIFDLDTATVSKYTRDYLKNAEKNKQVIYINYELPKSFIICQSSGEQQIYVSQISTATLLKRADFIKNL